jgi:hypothetical protein
MMTIETHNTNPVKTKPRRWFRFRLGTLLVMVTLLSVPLGWAGWELDQRRSEKATIAWVQEMRGEVYFHPFIDERSWWAKTKDEWFGERVLNVYLDNTQVSNLSPLLDLKNLKYVTLKNTNVSDLSPLGELKNLEELWLIGTQASEEQLEELRLALPNCEIRMSD